MEGIEKVVVEEGEVLGEWNGERREGGGEGLGGRNCEVLGERGKWRRHGEGGIRGEKRRKRRWRKTWTMGGG